MHDQRGSIRAWRGTVPITAQERLAHLATQTRVLKDETLDDLPPPTVGQVIFIKNHGNR